MEREIELKKQLAKRRYVDPAEIAYDYAHLGDAEQTFAWLEKARAEKSGALENIKIVRPHGTVAQRSALFRSSEAIGATSVKLLSAIVST
jgi:hypothetical protein